MNNLLAKQASVSEAMPKIMNLFVKYEISIEKLNSLETELNGFTVRVPLVGAFSSGKTSLLNALLQEKIFAVEVNPETALPVELRYGDEEAFIGHKAGQSPRKLSRSEVLGQQFDIFLPDGWIEARLPSIALQKIPYLTLVDMPGWDSGFEQHAKAIDNYLSRSLAYCLVVSVDEGTLHASLQAFLKELSQRNMPTVLVISKSDKRPQEDVASVRDKVLDEVVNICGSEPLAVVEVSARKQNIDEFIVAMKKMQEQVGERFDYAVCHPILQEMSQLDKRLDILLNQENLSSEELAVRKNLLEKELDKFRADVIKESSALDVQVEPAVSQIVSLLNSRLRGALDSLASATLHNGDVQGQIGQLVRLATSEGIKQEFSPKLRHYFKRLESDMPSELRLDHPFIVRVEDKFDSENNDVSDAMQTALGGLAGQVLARIPFIALGPIGIAISTVLGALIPKVLKSIFDDDKAEDEARARLEHARGHVLSNVIPRVLSQVEENLRRFLHDQVSAAQAEIMKIADVQTKQFTSSINQLESELAKENTSFEQRRLAYQEDRAALNELASVLQAAR